MGLDAYFVKIPAGQRAENLSHDDLEGPSVKILGQYRSAQQLHQLMNNKFKDLNGKNLPVDTFFVLTPELLSELELAQSQGLGETAYGTHLRDTLAKCRIALYKGFQLAYYASY